MDYQENQELKAENSQLKPIEYLSMILSALCVILPFTGWLKVPVAAGLYSLFGMSDEPTKFSLFGYIFSGSSYQDSSVILVVGIIALIAVLGIILNCAFIVKTFKKKEKRYKYGTIGAVIMLLVSALFIVIVGLMSVILSVIELTYAPYLTLAVSIADIVVIKNVKKQNI